jgi:apolipoprotein N-acyltransferase
MGLRARIAAAVASAVLTPLAFPAVDLGFLGWLSVAPLLIALRRSPPLGAAGLGLLFGCGLAGGVFHWLGLLATMTVATTVVMYVGFGLYYAAFGLLYNRLASLPAVWVLLGAPALWVALEYARASLSFLALPWNLLGHSQYRYLPVIQVADVTGVSGISFLMVMTNQLASQLAERLARRPTSPAQARARHAIWRPNLLIVAVILFLTLVYGLYRQAAPDGSERVRVAVVQANVLARDGMSSREQVGHLRAYDRLTREGARERPDLVVWPSSSLPGPLDSRIVSFVVTRLVRDVGIPLLAGGAGGDKLAPARDGVRPYSNTEFLVAPSGRVEAQYSKIRLTPFNEYVPLRGTIPWPRWLTTMKDSFVAGVEYTLFRVGEARFGAPICWENTFPDLFRRFVRDGANLMVSVTNEGFLGETAGPHQTLAMNVFRAVENRVAVVRAATTGVSAFIDARGRIVRRVADAQGRDVSVAGVIVWDVPLATTRSFYTQHGDVFAMGATGFAAVLLLAALLARRPHVVAGAVEPAT